MIEYNLAKRENIKKISEFIAKLNKDEKNHVAYCGDNVEEIENSLIGDISDVPFEKSFVTTTENGELIGVLGFDADIERENAEILGPFIKKSKWNIANEMWNRMIQLLPKEIKLISMFINEKNKNCFKLAQTLNFHKKSEENIMVFEKSCVNRLDNIPLTEIAIDDYENMKLLHDKVFPNTYYSGEDIIKRLNSNRKVFIYRENNKLEGYIYAEVEPEFGEGNIEFFAVSDSQRGKGIGYKLLCMALRWFFSFESINCITLCVNSENSKALNLYERVGFKQKKLLYYLTKNIK